MPAYARHEGITRPRERAYALVAVIVVQVALGLVLLNGLRVQIGRSADAVQRLVEVALPTPPPPQPPRTQPKPRPVRHSSSAPKAEPKPLGGSPGPAPAHAPPSVAPVVAIRPTVAPSGGGSGTGPAIGSGAGGGTGGQGYGAGDGGAELEFLSGEITVRDYPPDLGRAGVGGRVEVLLNVAATGRVTRCSVLRSSRVPQLDALTCRLMQQRFVFRPSTDRSGRPVADEVEWDHDWIPPRNRY